MTVPQLLDLLRARLAVMRGEGATYAAIAARMRHADGARHHAGTLRNFGAGAPAGLDFVQDLLDAFPELAAPPLPVCPTCGQLRRRELALCHGEITRRRGPLPLNPSQERER